ncbi:MAG: universal stress protein [Deltaproteobacteria bacterium]|nr:universal stress protein [Deltaproteobacteria bacterium]
MLLDDRENQLFPVSNYGISEKYLRKGPLFVNDKYSAFVKGKPVYIENIQDDTRIQYPEAAAECHEDWHISLVHFFRKSSASEELMGKKFTKEQPARMLAVLQKAKDRLVENGFNPEKIKTELIEEPYPTVADGIIDQFNKGDFETVLIGRKRMSKAEEFVMGDISVKLIRALEDAAVLVVKSR